MVVMGKYPPTRRIRTNNDLPARAHLNCRRILWLATACSESVLCFFPASSSSESWSPTTWGAREGDTSRDAFALAALAIVGTHLPSALQAYLLTLAAVKDLVAIAIIAVHQIAHGSGRQATFDWKITDGGYPGGGHECRRHTVRRGRRSVRADDSASLRIGIGVVVLGIIIVADGVVLLVVGIRMHSRPGPRAAAADANVSGPAVAGDRPSLTSAWVPVRRCRS
jgi:hypothetical protein